MMKPLSERILTRPIYYLEAGREDEIGGYTILVSELDEVVQLEAERDDYRNQYHMAEAKVLSRDALLEQLSEEQLTQDVAKAEAENEALRAELRRERINHLRVLLQAGKISFRVWQEAVDEIALLTE